MRLSSSLLFCLWAHTAAAAPVPVEISANGGLLRGGKPWFVKGAAGDTRLAEMQACGANSFRTWSTTDLDKLLPEAEARGLTVCAGIWLESECNWFSYHRPADCEKQTRRVLEQVKQYMDSPALLFWGLGNESEGDGTNAAYWQQINRLARAVHELDPHHPTFTAVAGFSPAKKAGVDQYAPALDFIGINTYAALPGLREHLASMHWTRPWVITEYGPRGFWESPRAPWGAPLEQTSSEKAAMLEAAYQKTIAPGGTCLGSYAFLWGHKQEATTTWFGLFTDKGERTASLDVLQRLWTGREPSNRAPEVRQLDFSAARKVVKAGETLTAKVDAADPDRDPISVRWEIQPDLIRRGQEGREIPYQPVSGCIIATSHDGVTLTTPSTPGDYRLFVWVLDGAGNAGTANAPFRVEK